MNRETKPHRPMGGNGAPVRVGGDVGVRPTFLPRSAGADLRRFQITHALRALEDALILLDSRPAEGIELGALERVRDDLRVVARLARAEAC